MRVVRRVVIITAVALGLGAAPAGASTAPVPTARVVTSVWATGALLSHRRGDSPDVSNKHTCSASVIQSRSHDLILTAAHCIRGRDRVFDFVPDFHDGRAPHGVWTVAAVYLPYAWKHWRSQRADFAILRLARHQNRSIQAMVGARPVGDPDMSLRTRVAGYPSGTDGRPIVCANHIYRTNAYASFDCRGYVGGVSGGPFIQQGRLVGVVGGLHYGGCVSSTTYATPLGNRLQSLMGRAEAGGPGDRIPATLPRSGC